MAGTTHLPVSAQTPSNLGLLFYPYHYKKKSFISDKIFRGATDGTRMEHGFPKETFQVKLSAFSFRV